MKNKKGFTLAELLIVVAIIAVLTAISIPIFTSRIENGRETVDTANIRSQYSEIIVEAITTGEDVNTDGKNKVILQQKIEDWQSEELYDSLVSIATMIIDYPRPGGTAWVSYEQNNKMIIIHFDDGSGSSGGAGPGTISNTVPAGTQYSLSDYSKMSRGKYSISINSPVSGTIQLELVVHAGKNSNSAEKKVVEIEVVEGNNTFSFDNTAQQSSFAIRFKEEINTDDAKSIIANTVITKIGNLN